MKITERGIFMDNLVKLLILAGLVYGVIWVSQNVDFNKVMSDAQQRIEQEKTVSKVTEGRQRADADARKVTE